MQIKQLLTDDDAVSPVIGVILMVAITVILAAVIAAFVLGLGDTNDVAPNVSFDYDYDETNTALDVTVTSGDTFDAERVSFEGDDGGVTVDTDFSSQVTSGDTAELSSVSSGETVRIIWTSESGDTSSEIGSFSGPDA